MRELPIYDIKLTDDSQGVGFISLVDEPAIGVDWIKLAKVTIKQEPKKVNSMMARKALGTLDGSGCFGCPPNGDGTKANGEPDGRCKGDGSDKTGGGKGGSKSPKSTTKGRDSAERLANPTLEDPPTLKDKQKIDADSAKKNMDEAVKSGDKNRIRSAQTRIDDLKNRMKLGHPTYDYQVKSVNKTYDELIDKEIAKLPNPYDAKPSYVNGDRTWDYKTGQSKEAPAGKQRAIIYDRRSSEDVLNGYPQYKIYIDWE